MTPKEKETIRHLAYDQKKSGLVTVRALKKHVLNFITQTCHEKARKKVPVSGKEKGFVEKAQ